MQFLRARWYDTDTGRFISEDSYLGTQANLLSRNRYIYTNNNPVNYVDPSGHMPAAFLQAMSMAYNTGLFDDETLAIAVLALNGGNLFTGFHEIAQLNLAKELSKQHISVTLEYSIEIASEKGENYKCTKVEADVVADDYYVWEIKPTSYQSGSKRQTAIDQLEKYKTHGNLEEGYAFGDINDINIFGNIKMRIKNDKTQPGLVYYEFYRENLKGVEVPVTLSEVKKEFEAKAVAVLVVFVVVMGYNVVENLLTAGAGVLNDMTLLGLAAETAKTLFAY